VPLAQQLLKTPKRVIAVLNTEAILRYDQKLQKWRSHDASTLASGYMDSLSGAVEAMILCHGLASNGQSLFAF
jgi:hypothetical protein